MKPYVILTMMTSIDGKIEGDFIHEHNEELSDYFEHQKLQDTDAWGNGCITHQKYFSDESIDLAVYEGAKPVTEDYVVQKQVPYVISFDTTGKVLWNTDTLKFPDDVYNHVLVVTTRSVRPEYAAHLRNLGIPYILAGDKKIDPRTALYKLHTLFDINRFAIVGGATINACFLKENLVDEIRLIITPFIDGSMELTIAETPDDVRLTKEFKLDSVSRLEHDGVLLTYKRKSNENSEIE